jgi:hypothetical protein
MKREKASLARLIDAQELYDQLRLIAPTLPKIADSPLKACSALA